MKEDKLGKLSMELSVSVLNLVKELREKKENIVSNQIGRSATSVCANIAESKYGHSRADFIAKLEIALKEASETGKWLDMLYQTNYIEENKYKEIKSKISPYQIVTMGDFLMYIEGNLNIITISSQSIVLKVLDGVIIVSGKDLSIKDISINTITIVGNILSWEKVWWIAEQNTQ